MKVDVEEVVKVSLGKSRTLDRDISHVTFFLSITDREESEDTPAGQTWLSAQRVKELAQQVRQTS